MTNSPHLPSLFLHEELLLLALSEEKGTLLAGSWFPQAAGAGMLAELLLAERVKVVPNGKKNFLEVIRHESIGDELSDEWLTEMDRSPKRKVLRDWLSSFANTKNLKQRVADRLLKLEILEKASSKVLFVFNRTIYPELDSGPEQAIRDRLRAAIFIEATDVSAHDIALISIAKSSGILDVVFERRELKQRKARIEELIAGEVTGAATRELVQALTLVIASAAFIPILTT